MGCPWHWRTLQHNGQQPYTLNIEVPFAWLLNRQGGGCQGFSGGGQGTREPSGQGGQHAPAPGHHVPPQQRGAVPGGAWGGSQGARGGTPRRTPHTTHRTPRTTHHTLHI